MHGVGSGSVVQAWQSLLDAGPVAGLDDGTLLERFVDLPGDAAETAFAALVARHGPMVQWVCRRLLDDPHDADDAFQATWLVLARKARGIQRPDRLANWLYGTALRAARRLRTDQARRRQHEASRLPVRSEAAPDRTEDAAIVLEEVARLPQPCRVAVVLCDLEGMTQAEAAGHLGCSERTLRRRLTQAHDRLRIRLIRRGLTAPLAAFGLRATSITESLVTATARLAGPFASRTPTAGLVPASTLTLAEGVMTAMSWTKWQGIAAVAGICLALGGGIGADSGFLARSADMPAPAIAPAQVPTQAPVVAAEPSPANRYQALVKKYDDALKVYQAAISQAMTDAARTEAYKLSPNPANHSPAFLALAEEFPQDPVAVDALFWVANHGLSSVNPPGDPGSQAYVRALTMLARDHADEPRIGPYCPSLIMFPDSAKTEFLRTVVGRSRNRAVQGQANLTLFEYLRGVAAMAELFQHPDHPVAFDDLIPRDTPDQERRTQMADPVAFRRRFEEFYGRWRPDSVAILKRADIAALRGEADRALDRVVTEFADVPAVTLNGKPTRETFGDLAHRLRQPRPPLGPEPPPAPPSQVEPIAQAFQAAMTRADQASAAAGPGEAGMKVYFAACPKWADFGPKMGAIAAAAPRSSEAFDALIWIVGSSPRFLDSGEDRAAMLGQAVDSLIRDHLDFLGDHLDDRKIIGAFNFGGSFPCPHVDRIFQALAERGRTREIRGRMKFLLARHRKGEADLAASFEVRGADPARRPEIALFAPSYLASLRQTGRRRLADEAATLLEQVRAEFGDVTYVNGSVPTSETLATVADRELTDIRTLAVGQPASEITGKDVAGQPMTLSEFRGKVVVLDFGTHEHCGGCQLVYPRQRELVAKFQARPFALLGINTSDRLETLRDLAARREITWRCWWDGDDPVHPGPITTRWNIRGYPTFIVLDHRGVIRFKDLHPHDPQFAPIMEGLVREAEGARP